MSFLGGFAAAISQAFYQLDDLFPGLPMGHGFDQKLGIHNMRMYT